MSRPGQVEDRATLPRCCLQGNTHTPYEKDGLGVALCGRIAGIVATVAGSNAKHGIKQW